MKRLVFDFETNGYLDAFDTVWGVGIMDLDTGVTDFYSDHAGTLWPSLRQGLDRLLAADLLIAHNAMGFDLPALEKITGRHIDRSKVRDTLVMARLQDPEALGGHSIEAWGDRLDKPKGDVTDFSRWDDAMVDYCLRDVEICAEVYRRAQEVEDWGDALLATEQPFAEIIAMQMRAGFAFDERAALTLAAELQEEAEALATKLRETFTPLYLPDGHFVPKKDDRKRGYTAGVPLTKVELTPFNPGSRQHIALWLQRKRGWKPKVFTSTGIAQIDEAILRRVEAPEAETLIQYLTVQKKYGMLAGPPKKNGTGGGWLHHLNRDTGRIYGYVNSNGAVTGRCTHSRPNVAQADKDKRMRALWVHSLGQLVGCDADGLELRMLAHYLGRWDGGAYAHAMDQGQKEDGTDAHTLTQKAVGLHKRDSAKTLMYAVLYGAGDAKAGSVVIADAKEAGKPVKGAASALGKAAKAKLITGIKGFSQLKNAIGKTLKHTKPKPYLKGLDGRKLWIRSEHAALNTLLQSAGAVVMKRALILHYEQTQRHGLVHGRDFMYVGNIHDEVQMDCKPEFAEKLGESFALCITLAGEQFNLRCPLRGNYDIGGNWSETH